MLSIPNHRFGSPGLPTAENHVKSLIQAAEANIGRLTAQIDELRSILATLRLMVVPIGKLPMELLVEIFRIAVDEAADTLRMIFCLWQVSPYWRQIVQETPELWAKSQLQIKLGRELTDPYLNGLKTMFARSTPYPISVTLIESPQTPSNRFAFPESCRRLADIIIPTAARWKNLDINLGSFLYFEGLPPGTFEALESLEIRGFRGQDSPIVIFQSSSRLKSFTLDTTASKIHLIHIPWGQLTHLDITDYSIGGCRNVLLQCDNLISARFNTSFEWDFTPEQVVSPIVILPFLKTLALTFQEYGFGPINGFEAFLMPLSLPSLTRIDFEFSSEDEERWPTEAFSAFQGRAPQIQRITLLYSEIDEHGLLALLRNGPSLTTLRTVCCWDCVDDAFFDALRYHDDDLAPIAPKLEDIDIFNFNLSDECPEGPLEEFIRSRWWEGERVLPDGSPPRVSRLKRVSVRNDSDLPSASEVLKARMEELVLQGLDVSFT
ncbi:hypothetical protein K438DRAFT_1818472 [Mycena galopus ATCC 62051]|nr:hypothetical protein K438DRAFT_1818472 [Mycena galopus ATCC 62051]